MRMIYEPPQNLSQKELTANSDTWQRMKMLVRYVSRHERCVSKSGVTSIPHAR